MWLFLQGTLLGVPAIFFIGPVLLTLLQASVEHGFKAGFTVAFGIAISDVACIALVYLGASSFFANPSNKAIVGIAGGVILIGFGLSLALRKPALNNAPVSLGSGHLLALFAKGFVVNFANPFVFAYWIGALGAMASQHVLNPLNTTIYFSGAIAVIFGTDVLKAAIAERIKDTLTPKVLSKINLVAGIFLIGFGISLIVRVL